MTDRLHLVLGPEDSRRVTQVLTRTDGSPLTGTETAEQTEVMTIRRGEFTPQVELAEIEEYEIDSDLLTPGDAFSVTVPTPGTAQQRRDMLALVRSCGLRLSAFIQREGGPRALQLVGCLDKRAQPSALDGTKLTLSGTDNGGLLTRATADPRLGISEETSLVQMVRAVLEPFGMEVVTEGAPSRTLCTGQRLSQEAGALLAAQARSYGIRPSQVSGTMLERRALEGDVPLDGRRLSTVQELTRLDGSPLTGAESADETVVTTRSYERARRGHASGMTGSDVERLRVSEAKPSVGETCWDFIDRHCRRLGVLPWIDARGRLIIGSPDYDQDPMWIIRRKLNGESNVLSGGVVEDFGAISSECTVYGRTGGSDAARSPFHARVVNPNQPFYRPLVISDPSVRTEEQARRRAVRELNRQNESAFVLEYEMAGHGQGEFIYAIDTVADVLDEAIGIEGLFYVTGRTFKGSRSMGARTRLRLIPLGAISL